MPNQENKFKNIDNNQISFKEIIFHFKEWLMIGKKNYKSLFIASITGILLGILVSYIDKPNYKAVLTFALEEDKNGGGGGLGGAIGLASSFGIDLGSGGGGAFAASNLTELMKSRLIVEKVLLNPIVINNKITTLAEFFIENSKMRNKWDQDSSYSKIHFTPYTERSKFSIKQDSILYEIYKKLIYKDFLSISQKDKKATILTIEVLNENELFAKLFCENIAKETSDFYIETKSKKARINASVLEKQVDSIKKELNSAIKSVAKEADNVYNLNPAFNIKGTSSKRKQIDVQANTGILTNLTVQLELAKITLRKETPLIQLIDTPILPLEKSHFGIIKSSLIFGITLPLILFLGLVLNEVYKKIIQ